MRSIKEVLVSIFQPFYWATQPFCEISNQDIFRIDMTLATKTPANIGRHNSNLFFSHIKGVSHLSTNPMHNLCRGPNCMVSVRELYSAITPRHSIGIAAYR